MNPMMKSSEFQMFVDDTVVHSIDPGRKADTIMHPFDPGRICKLFFIDPVPQGLNDVRVKSSIALSFFLIRWLF
jgi:hypothetical protein